MTHATKTAAAAALALGLVLTATTAAQAEAAHAPTTTTARTASAATGGDVATLLGFDYGGYGYHSHRNIKPHPKSPAPECPRC
ncbi:MULTISPECIES: hypothetical protein [Clavibacter]|uniref:Uncharacterized protein n=1 Tax=Clavibacter tessellarius TaxID=31965 RepID=A0A154UYU2_9MICO|nr:MULTISPECIES: hypothetical protein [Clavibacter]KZC94124.1 hypothetical protein AWH51_14620 [Clavibacter michiganensis subsp. tessellarius]MDA3804276.1 hypothetical protein [Clavibacter sp. CT19]